MLTIIRYGEIALKGLNRSYFENKLVENIRLQTKAKVWKKRGRIYAEIDKDKLELLGKIFGVTSYSQCLESELDYDSIKDAIMNLGLDGLDHDVTFRVSCKRMYKNFHPSREIEIEIGSFINEKFGFKVDLKNYDLNVCIEITDKANIFTEKTSGLGGFPVGVAGDVECKLDIEKSLLSAFLLAKRGCKIIPIEGSDEKIINQLQKYLPYNLKNASSKKIIGIGIPDTLNKISENLETFTLRPLIGMNEEDIKNKLATI